MGKITEVNKKANKILTDLFESRNITYCEICGGTWALSFAHRHKRLWYRSQLELLWDFNQVLLLCAYCHSRIEVDKDLTAMTFDRIRGFENA